MAEGPSARSRDDSPYGEEDDEEDEGPPKAPKPRDGQDRLMSPEETARLIETLKLDANRKLPMGFEQEAMTKKRTGRHW